MKYSREEIARLIELAFKGAAVDNQLQAELGLTEVDIARKKKLLTEESVMGGLEILFNAIYPRMQEEVDPDPPILQTARNYPLEYLEISGRPRLALSWCERFGKIRTVADLLRLSEHEISQIRGIGVNSKSMEEIRAKRSKFIEDYNSGLIK